MTPPEYQDAFAKPPDPRDPAESVLLPGELSPAVAPVPPPVKAKAAVRVAKRSTPVEIQDIDDEPPFEPTLEPVVAHGSKPKLSNRETRENQTAFDFVQPDGFRMPELAMLAKPKPRSSAFDEGSLRQNARMLEGVLAEFGVRGQIDQIRPGPVVTLYELVPALADVVLSVFGVIFASDPLAAAAEMARVTAPGGRIVFTAWDPSGAVHRAVAVAGEAVRNSLGAPPSAPPFPIARRQSPRVRSGRCGRPME